jgi:hypothetical protein
MGGSLRPSKAPASDPRNWNFGIQRCSNARSFIIMTLDSVKKGIEFNNGRFSI